MDRRNFLRTLVGGVAVGAAVRQWPFRVYSFPAMVAKPRLDLGFNVFDYAGLPFVSDPACPPNRVYMIHRDGVREFDGNGMRELAVYPSDQLTHLKSLYARYQLSKDGR